MFQWEAPDTEHMKLSQVNMHDFGKRVGTNDDHIRFQIKEGGIHPINRIE